MDININWLIESIPFKEYDKLKHGEKYKRHMDNVVN